MKTKVCFFIKTLNNSGGTERVTTVLANALADDNFDVHIITWYGGTTSFYPVSSKVKLHYVFKQDKSSIYKEYFNALKIYRNILKSIAPDFVVDVCVPLSLLTLPATIGSKIKVISWEHFNTSVTWNGYTSRLSRFLVGKYAYHVVVLTNTDRNNYLTKFKAKKVTCIVNPITVKPNGLPNLKSKNVLAIGRFTYQKGFDLLLNIWSKIVLEKADWKLRIIGGGELKNEITSLSKSLALDDFVEFIEPTNNVSDYYLSSSIFVMSSRFEGLPLVLIEAKAFGLPIISFDCETGPRDIINHRKDGVLVPYPDTEQFVEELLSLMNDKEQRVVYSYNALKDTMRFSTVTFFSSWKKILE